ncbi:MAG: DUF2007 domain-containing protein [Bacteroidales bacterium]|nr:DUF2007 domain-containing protein [Bacteroidales bacterium]
MNTEFKPVQVFAGTIWQAGMVKSMLEDAGIRAFLKDEVMGTMNPWWTAPGGAGSVGVMVAGRDWSKARVIVDEYERHLNDTN